MGEVTDVYLISGFLGAGKTTFLNRLVKRVPEELTFLVLMNEFGEMGLDGTLVEGDDVDMIEISKGSIFCACVKTDFIKALHELATKVRPHVMLIETTGVANPKDLDRDLKLPIFGGRFLLRDKFCLVDAANFLDTYESFLAIEKQLESSDIFIVNKVDLSNPGEVARIEEVILGFNPEARFIETTFADVDFDGLFGEGALREAVAGDANGGVAAGTGRGEDAAGMLSMTEEQLDRYIDALLEDETAEVTPPDRLLSTVVEWGPGSRQEFESWLERLPKLVRGKGVVELDGEPALFNLVNGRWTVEGHSRSVASEVVNRLVFISRPDEIQAINEGV
jgi:G3E family GTPase